MKNLDIHRIAACGGLTPFLVSLLLFPCAGLAAGTDGRPPPPETGVWIDHSGDGAVEIYTCADRADRLCGRIIWLREPLNAEGVPKHDKYNPTASLKNRPICGLPVLGNLAKVPEGGFDNGWIYDPKVGKSYSAAIELSGRDRLTVTGYVGLKFLSKSFSWRRAPGDIQRCDGAPPSAAPIKNSKPPVRGKRKETIAAVPAPAPARKSASVLPEASKVFRPATPDLPKRPEQSAATPQAQKAAEIAIPPPVPKPGARGPATPAAKSWSADPGARYSTEAAVPRPRPPTLAPEQRYSVGGPKAALMPWELYRLGEEE